MCPPLKRVFLMAALVLTGCQSASVLNHAQHSHFIGLSDFSKFSRTETTNGGVVLLSPEIESPVEWDQLVLSWNASLPAGTTLEVEARSWPPEGVTKFYSMGRWSLADKPIPRTSVSGQKDRAGDVQADTLMLNRPATTVQLRLTARSANNASPTLKFLGISFCDTKSATVMRPPHRAAWGKIILTPERSQQAYPGGRGWCSPTALAMVLARWAEVLQRPELNLSVPQVALKVFDQGYNGTGNWAFNVAFAGSLPGMRAYVARLDDVGELEDWISAGIPVILSARWDWLQPGRPDDPDGHLVVCIGFTKNGDVVINDPATNLKTETVRRIYKRENVICAWAASHNTVYLVYPEGTATPVDRFGHWAK